MKKSELIKAIEAEWGTLEDAMQASMAGNDYPGICLKCGSIAYGVEPDARNYTCEDCGQPAVYGLEESFFLIL